MPLSPRTALLLFFLSAAAGGLLPAAARGAPAAGSDDPGLDAPFDQRLSPEFDRSYMDWLGKKLGVRFDPATGVLTLPDGRAATRRESLEPYFDDGAVRLSPQLRSILLSYGVRPALRDGRPAYLNVDCDKPITLLDVELDRELAAKGALKDAATPFDPSEATPDVLKLFADLYGWKADGGSLRDSSGRVVTAGDVSKLSRRARAGDDPAADAVARSAGYSERVIGGARFLYAPDGKGAFTRFQARMYLAAYGLPERAALGAAYDARKAPPAIADSLRQAGAEISADGAVSWQGRPLTNGAYLALMSPAEISPTSGRDAIVAALAGLSGYAPEISEGRTYLQAPNGAKVTPLVAAQLLNAFGLSGQKSLDGAFDAKAAGTSPLVVDLLRSAGATVRGDGTVVESGRTLTVRRLVELLEPYPKSSGLLSSQFLLERGWTGKNVGGREVVLKPDGGTLTNLEAAALARSGEYSLSKLGLLQRALNGVAGGPLDPATLQRLKDIAADQGGFLPARLRQSLDAAHPSGTALRAVVDASDDAAIRYWSGLAASQAASTTASAADQKAAAERAARAARGGQAQLSDRLEASFEAFYAAQGSAVAAQERELFRDPRTGRLQLPPLYVEFRGDREDAHFDSTAKEIVFNASPLVDEMARAAQKALPAAQRTPEALKRLQAEYSDIEKLRAALYGNPAVRDAFLRREAWNYIHEHGHALSALNGPASIERAGDIAAPRWVDDERVAFLWETRYTHDLLTKNPAAPVPSWELQRYRRMLAGYDLWSADIVREHETMYPGDIVELKEAQDIQAGTIARLRRLAADSPVPGAQQYLQRLDEGQKSLATISGAYDRYLDENGRKEFPQMRVAGQLAMAERSERGTQGAGAADALRYRAQAMTTLRAELADGELTPAQGAPFAARLPPLAALVKQGVALSGALSARREAVPASTAEALETLAQLCRHAQAAPSPAMDAGLSRAELAADVAMLDRMAQAAWAAETPAVTPVEFKK